MNRFLFSRRPFTLTELLIVIGVIAVLASLLFSALQGGVDQSKLVACRSNLRQIGIALTGYLDAYKTFPQACNMPALGVSPYPGIAAALNDQLSGSTEVFECPADTKDYFKDQGTSYEWEPWLNGQPRTGLTHHGHPVKESETRVLWDMESFHGPEGEPESRNILMLDTVVRKL